MPTLPDSIPSAKEMHETSLSASEQKVFEESEKVLNQIGEIIRHSASTGCFDTSIVLKDSQFWPSQVIIDTYNLIKSKMVGYVVSLSRNSGDAEIVISW